MEVFEMPELYCRWRTVVSVRPAMVRRVLVSTLDSLRWLSRTSAHRAFSAAAAQPIPLPLIPHTLADQACPYISRHSSTSTPPSHDPLDFELYPNFFNHAEQKVWLNYLLSTLDRVCARPRRSRSRDGDEGKCPKSDGFQSVERYAFESGHFDTVITDYREYEIRSLDQISETEIQDLLKRVTSLIPTHSTNLLAHILHLSSTGRIDPHVDHPSASGSTILGLSLGNPRVMHLFAHEKDHQPIYKILLEPGSVYLQR